MGQQRRQWTWEKYVEEFGFPVESIPDVGYAATGNADSEKIASLKPDLVVAPFRLADLEKVLGKYGIPVLYVDFYDQKNTCDSILLLGYYATPENAPYSLENRFDRPGREHLQTVNNKRVFYIHHGLSRHIYDFVSLQYFAKWIRPEAFQDLDPEDAWREVHERFLPVGFGGKWGMP